MDTTPRIPSYSNADKFKGLEIDDRSCDEIDIDDDDALALPLPNTVSVEFLVAPNQTPSSKKFKWTKALENRLCDEVKKYGASEYPFYITSETRTNWSNLPIAKEYPIPSKKLRDHYINILSPYVDNSPFRADEIALIDKYLSKAANKAKTSWTDLSLLLYSKKLSGDKYRSPSHLRNFFYTNERSRMRAEAAQNKASLPKETPTTLSAPQTSTSLTPLDSKSLKRPRYLTRTHPEVTYAESDNDSSDLSSNNNLLCIEKVKTHSIRVSKANWTKELDTRLCREVKKAGIPPYPCYIQDSEQIFWTALPISKDCGFNGKQLRERYFNILSPRIDRSPLRDKEIEIINDFVSSTPFNSSISWTKLSSLLYKKKLSRSKYRPADDLKNFFYSKDRRILQDPEKTSLSSIQRAIPRGLQKSGNPDALAGDSNQASADRLPNHVIHVASPPELKELHAGLGSPQFLKDERHTHTPVFPSPSSTTPLTSFTTLVSTTAGPSFTALNTPSDDNFLNDFVYGTFNVSPSSPISPLSPVDEDLEFQ